MRSRNRNGNEGGCLIGDLARVGDEHGATQAEDRNYDAMPKADHRARGFAFGPSSGRVLQI